MSLSQQSACQNHGPTMQVSSSSVSSENVLLGVFPKEVSIVGVNGPFYPNFAPQQQLQACIALKHFACRVHIMINRQMKYEIYEIFKSFFNLRVLFLYSKRNLFCLFEYLPNCRCQEYISYLFIFLDFKSDMMRLCNEQTTVTYAYFPKKVPFCGKSGILIHFQASQHMCLFQDFQNLNLLCGDNIRYQSITKVN